MDLDKLNFSLRNRTPWEGIDLGIAMARRYFKEIYLPWVSATVVYSIILYVIFFEKLSYGVFIFIWTLPIFERICLFAISRSIFQSSPGFWPSIKAAVKPFNFSWLFLQLIRYSVIPYLVSPSVRYRSFLLPVMQLEGLSGSKGSRRGLGLSQNIGGSLVYLIFIFTKIEFFIFWAFFIMICVMNPEQTVVTAEDDWIELLKKFLTMDFDTAYYHLYYILCCVTCIFIRPFFVCAGFAMYLMRRVDLEGWDIELQFKNLANRLAKVAQPLIILLCVFCLFPEVEAKDPQLRIKDIKATEEFNEYKTIQVPERDEPDIGEVEFSGGGSGFGSFMAGLIKILGIGAIIAIIAYMIYKYAIDSPGLDPSQKKVPREKPSTILGMSMDKIEKNQSWLDEAYRYLDEGNFRACLSHLYRGALSKLVHEHELRLKESFTELDCLGVIDKMKSSGIPDYMKELTTIWLHMAYAHKEPDEKNLRHLLDQWQNAFSKTSQRAVREVNP